VFRHMPLSSIHKNALIAAEAAEAAHDQGKFWEYHDLLFERQEEWAEEKEIEVKLSDYAEELGLDRERFVESLEEGRHKELVMSDYGEAMRLGVRGTPTFFVTVNRLQLEICCGLWRQSWQNRIEYGYEKIWVGLGFGFFGFGGSWGLVLDDKSS